MKLKTTYRLILPVLSLSIIFNFALTLFVIFRIRKPVSYNVVFNEPPSLPSLEIPTNTVSRAGLLPFSASNPTPSPSPPPLDFAPPPTVYSLPYHYCVVAGRRVAYINGFPCYEGDEHAYGVVSRIFPERIYLVDGSYINNQNLERFFDHDCTRLNANSERGDVLPRSIN